MNIHMKAIGTVCWICGAKKKAENLRPLDSYEERKQSSNLVLRKLVMKKSPPVGFHREYVPAVVAHLNVLKIENVINSIWEIQ